VGCNAVPLEVMPSAVWALRHQIFWNRFKQQRLKTWQPAFAQCSTFLFHLVCGIVFLCNGAWLLLTSWSVAEYVRDYTDLADPANGVGSFVFQITRDVQPPLWISYQLDGFHQNHRRYVQSRNDGQLQEPQDPKYSEDDLMSCWPWVVTEDARVRYPCGLIARSVFNDTFALVLEGSAAPGRVLRVESSAATIAWPADSVGRFRNLDPEARAHAGPGRLNLQSLDMWILERFPPVACEQTEISDAKPFEPVVVARRNETMFDGATVEVADCWNYTSERPSCKFLKEGQPFECCGHYQEVIKNDWGIESGHFLVWMRTAGLPSFRKLWGKVNIPLKSGFFLRVHFKDNFPVKGFQGRKAFVISTSSVLGGRNDHRAEAHLALGSCCLLLGASLAWRRVLHRSRPADNPPFISPEQDGQ